MPRAKASTTVRLTLTVPEELYDTYAERANKFGRSCEDEMLLRLRDCATHTSVNPIYLDDTARNDLSQCAGRLLRSPGDVLAFARRMSSVTVQGIKIELSDQLAARLETRRFGRTLDELINRTVTESLETFVGLR